MSRRAAEERARAALDRRSGFHFAFYRMVFERLLRSDAHAVRVAAKPGPEVLNHPRLVFYSNHPSWWDPPLLMVLFARLCPGRRGFAPIEAAMAERYGFMPRIGAFGVDLESPRGARDFLAASQVVLERGDALVITAQGRFADARERPVALAPGIAHLAGHVPGTIFLPVALEYAFWTERRFEALVRFGAPVGPDGLMALPKAERHARLESALEAAMDRLAADSRARNAGAFENLLEGSTAINPVFDALARLRALAAGRRYVPGHGSPAT